MESRYYDGVAIKRAVDREALRDAALRRAVELAPFDVPEETVESEYRLLLADFRQRLTYDSMATGRPVYTYEGLEDRMAELRDEALFQIKAQMVLKDIIQREGLTVSSEELEEEGRAIAQRQGVPLEEVKGFLGEDLSLVKTDLLERKAMDLIIERAVMS